MFADVLKCWVVGQALKDQDGSYGRAWVFRGVFSTEVAALRVCDNPACFVGPATMDEALPEEVADWPGAFYPWEGAPSEDPE